MVDLNQFENLELRVGRITSSVDLEGGQYSTHVLNIDFGGEFGIRKSCARLVNYSHEDLINRKVLCLYNVEPKQVADHMSEVLVLGYEDGDGECILVNPDNSDNPPPLGAKVY
jgi:tRNA-binding protein